MVRHVSHFDVLLAYLHLAALPADWDVRLLIDAMSCLGLLESVVTHSLWRHESLGWGVLDWAGSRVDEALCVGNWFWTSVVLDSGRRGTSGSSGWGSDVESLVSDGFALLPYFDLHVVDGRVG